MITFVPEPHLLESPRGRDWPRLPAPDVHRPASPPREADVVIVGAGPAGIAVAATLWHHGVRNVVLVDRTGPPATRFLARIDTLGQRVLRSPYEHHPGTEGFWDCELLDFARLHWARLTGTERREIRMAQAGHRSVVPVDVFEEFCEHVVSGHGIAAATWRGVVREVLPTAEAVTVHADRFSVTSRHAVLCLGEERTAAPESWWGGGCAPEGVTYWDEPAPACGKREIVVGAGLTAAHLISSALAGGCEVHWVVREAERYQCADVNATFFRPEGRARFNRLAWAERRELMARYRRASIMFEFRPMIERAAEAGRLVVHRGRSVVGIRSGRGGTVGLRLEGGGRVDADHALLALGTTPSIGVGLLPDELLGARDGWPTLDGRTVALDNAPRVSMVGAAAAMILGPAARNIDGHRVASTRVAAAIAQALRQEGPAVPRPPRLHAVAGG